MKILVADDDRDHVDILTYWLRGHGHEIVRAFDGDQAITRWREEKPDLVILDITMPRVDGFEVCRRMSAESHALVLVLTCHQPDADEIRALDLGADDYVRKPFSPAKLLARINALSRRANAAQHVSSASQVSVGPISLDSMRHEAARNGARIRLTPIESRLLHLLLTHSGQVLTTDQIVERVWGYDDASDTCLVKTHIRHLRQKIEPQPDSPRYIVTVPGVGYTFVAQTRAPAPGAALP